MNDKPPPNKPPGKRGVNKATMDLPQEEFIDDQSATATESSPSPEPSKATVDEVAKSEKKSERL